MSENAQDEAQGQPGTTDGGGNPPQDGGAPATPEQKIAALEAERNELKDRMLRIAAEFENWKKRARKEQTDAEVNAREKVLKDMLEVADNLERALSAHAQAQGATAGNGSPAAADPGGIVKGVNLVLRLFQQKLERSDVRPFESLGQPFDPRLHEAISRVEHPEIPAGSVAVELQKGYKIGDRLLRPAMVSVSTGPKGQG